MAKEVGKVYYEAWKNGYSQLIMDFKQVELNATHIVSIICPTCLVTCFIFFFSK